MKSTILNFSFLLVLLSVTLIKAQSKISFLHNDYPLAIKQATSSNKPVFVMVYADWCPHCNKMRNEVLTDTTVVNFFNKNYISVLVNSETPNGKDFMKKFGVKSFPTFVYLDKNETILFKLNGEYKTDEFLSDSKSSLNPKFQFPYLESQFYKDVSNTENCLTYINALKKGKEKEKIYDAAKLYLDTQEESKLVTESNWKIIAAGVPDYNSKTFQFVLNHQKEFAAVSSEKRVQNKILNVISIMQKPFIENLDTLNYNKKRLLVKALKIDRVDSLTFRYDLTIYENAKNWKKYKEVTKESVEKRVWNDYKTINEIAKNYLENIVATDDLKLAITWVKRSIELNNTKENNFLLAKLYYKIKDKKLAAEYALKTRAIVSSMGWDSKEIDGFCKELGIDE